jgi:hypothetical protein
MDEKNERGSVSTSIIVGRTSSSDDPWGGNGAEEIGDSETSVMATPMGTVGASCLAGRFPSAEPALKPWPTTF